MLTFEGDVVARHFAAVYVDLRWLDRASDVGLGEMDISSWTPQRGCGGTHSSSEAYLQVAPEPKLDQE